MNRCLTLICLALLVPGTADAKKKKKSAEAEAPAEAEVTPDIPSDSNSAKFAEALLALNIERFSPTDTSSGAKFRYTSLTFNPDNTWQAVGYVEMMDEMMECTEGGPWSMEPAESATVATMSWDIAQTDCVSREVGHSTRYRVTIEGDRMSVEFR
ncbi:MAG: hypothetical protein ACI8RZ_005723 [Myxococcota bacterium]|jgi:hypothetical protein